MKITSKTITEPLYQETILDTLDSNPPTNPDFERAILLSEMTEAFDKLNNEAEAANAVMQSLCRLFNASAAFALKHNSDQSNFTIVASLGLVKQSLSYPVEIGGLLGQQVIEAGQNLFCPNIVGETGLIEIGSLPQDYAQAFIAAPLNWQGQRMGLLGIYCDQSWGINGNLSPNEQRIISEAAKIVARVLFNAQLLQEKETARNGFTDMLVYGLKGPMASIMGALDLLYDNQGADAQGAQLLTIARRNGARMLTMIETLLDLNQLERGSIQLDLERAHLQQLIGIAQQALEEQFHLKALECRLSLPPEPLLITIDVSRILKVLHHLLDNALNFTREGLIEIKAESCQDEQGQPGILVAVSDTGIGIERDRVKGLFDRFSHADQYRQLDLASGGGLGLNYAKLVITAHGGQIWAESPGRLDSGTTFCFTLPL